MRPDAQQLGQIALALGLGAVAGYGTYRLGLPLPWMLGPMIINTFAALMRWPVKAPMKLRPIVIPLIGLMLGSAVSPQVFANASQWLVTIALLPVYLASGAGVSYVVYRRLGGFDPVTAFFSAMPGGLNDMVIIGGASGGDERRIALAHASRILTVIAFVSLFFGFFLHIRSSAAPRAWIALSALAPSDWAILAGCALVGVPLGQKLRLPAGNMLGPMLLSSLVHYLHIVTTAPPTLLINASQVVLGSVIGCRFLGAKARDIFRDLALGAISSAVLLAVAVGFSAIVMAATGKSVAASFLAYSPGGLTEMSLLALAMGQEVAYVSVSHILRIFMVILVAPLVFRALRR